MAWFLLEALVALLIAVAIVWWTMNARRKPPTSTSPPPRDNDVQCSVRGTDRVKGGIGASKVCPSSARIW